MTDYQTSAKAIIKAVGGKQNVTGLIHCSTRLRFTLANFDQADLKALKKIPGVLGAVIATGQCQVIIGNDVVEMFDAVNATLGVLDVNQGQNQQKWTQVILDFIIGIFQPLVPAIAGGGILKSLLMLFAMLGWMSDKSSTYQILTFIGTAPLYFLPILVAITTAQKLKVNVLVAVSTVAALLLPDMTTALTAGMQFMSLPVRNITYASQVFPAILCVSFYAVLEKYITKYCPKAIRIFFVPLLCMAIAVPVTLLVLGPAGYIFGEGFTAVILFLFSHFGWVATALLAAVLPFMVATGMHKAMIPYVVSAMSSVKSELLYIPASLAHNISESGTCFAIAIKTKDKAMRATAISAGISALFGITEPALYGITLQNKRAMFSVMASSLVGGAYVGFVGLKAFAVVGPGLASMTLFVDKANAANLVHALWGFAISLVLSFILGLILWQDKKTTVDNGQKAMHVVGSEVLATPISGQVIALTAVNDNVFSSGVLGDGIAVIPDSGELLAPSDGEIMMVYETQHALGLKTAGGAEILFHVGLDTVQLAGKYFDAQVQTGQPVKQGDVLLKFDLAQIKAAGFDPTVMMIVTNSSEQGVDLPPVMA
ncbi:beta-glucoside-specific PTS transporter subunit IIABC [Latilactobacillus graminis]|nr:beta-glucoside-specific PTS transporter subunit IIABC [Latilactobacillus graminis]QFP78812.1 PTS beta-glucoside transporter subunit IIBCA [Latilactobacillus graminis]